MKKKLNEGFGNSIPPEIDHVIIYFLQKEKTEYDAKTFYVNYSERKWLNLKGAQIKNWKMLAWEWIWSKSRQNQKNAEN